MPTPHAVHLSPPLAALVFTALSSGCVIPIAPQFDDPEKNYPPYIESSSPPVGEIFTQGTSMQDREITATLSDQNLNDHLFVRWLIDYPATATNPANLIMQAQFPPSGVPTRSPVRITPTCSIIGVGSGEHRLMLAVSDRPFRDRLSGEDVDPEAPLDSVPEGANRIRAMWVLKCP